MATKTLKTANLTGPALDWAVAKCEGWSDYEDDNVLGAFHAKDGEFAYLNLGDYRPSSNWSQGGPIIERERVELLNWGLEGWEAKATNYTFLNTPQEEDTFATGEGETALIASMRCYVASKLGDSVDVPEELIVP